MLIIGPKHKMNLVGDAQDLDTMIHLQPTGELMLDGGYLALESGNFETIRDLQHYGHTIKFEPGGFGGYQGNNEKR